MRYFFRPTKKILKKKEINKHKKAIARTKVDLVIQSNQGKRTQKQYPKELGKTI